MSQIQEKIRNLIQTLKIIESTPGITSSEIASILNCSNRTVQRYIKELRESGIMIDSSSGHSGGFTCRNGKKIIPIYLTLDEKNILSIAVNIFLTHKGFPFKKELISALEKIRNNSNMSFNDPVNYFSIWVPLRGNYEKEKFLIEEIKTSITKRKIIHVKYNSFSSGIVNKRKIAPYQTFIHDGFCYLVGHCYYRNEIRTFRIDRIQELQILQEEFDMDPNFNLENYMKSSWMIGKGEKTKVTIKFTPPIAQLIEEAQWHESQQIEKIDENGTILFTVVVEGTWEIKKWILGFGKYAEVLEPVALREEIRDELMEMVKKYDIK